MRSKRRCRLELEPRVKSVAQTNFELAQHAMPQADKELIHMVGRYQLTGDRKTTRLRRLAQIKRVLEADLSITEEEW